MQSKVINYYSCLILRKTNYIRLPVLLSLNASQYNQSRRVLSHYACERMLIRQRCVKKVRFLHTTVVPTHYMFLHHSVNVGIMARLT